MSLADRFESDQTFEAHTSRLNALPSYGDGWPRCPSAIFVGSVMVSEIPLQSEVLEELAGIDIVSDAELVVESEDPEIVASAKIELEDLVRGSAGQLAVAAA